MRTSSKIDLEGSFWALRLGEFRDAVKFCSSVINESVFFSFTIFSPRFSKKDLFFFFYEHIKFSSIWRTIGRQNPETAQNYPQFFLVGKQLLNADVEIIGVGQGKEKGNV